MAIAFSEVPVEALCKKVTSGATPLRSRSDYYEAGTIDWYKTGELKDWYLEPAEERIAEKALEETSVKLFPANTVLMAMYGDGRTITSMGMLRAPAATNQACAAMLVDEEKCNPRYFFYALKARRDLLLKVASGGAQRNLSGKLIKEFRLPVPALPVQHRIAGILSAYDELIENSQRRIKILESMARALYREWFVHFRFPGHESVPRVPSTLGEIPQGWAVKSVRQVAGLVSRGPSLSYVESGGVPVVNQRCIRNEEIEMQAVQYAVQLPEKKAHLYLQSRDILINSMGVGTLGRVSRNLTIDEPTIIHNCITVVRGKAGEPTTALLYYRLSDCQVHFESLGVGATGQTSLRIETIEDVQFAYPPLALLSDFEKVILPMWAQVGSLKRQVQKLRRIRDLLLPRLLSGQIDVEAMPS